MRRSTDDYDQELLQIRTDLASTRLSFLLLKLGLELKRYNPGQPRVPAGSREGGRWTDGKSVQSLFDRLKPRTDWASGRPRGGTVMRTINGRPYSVTPGQEMRLEIFSRDATRLTAAVRERDRDWRPQPGIYEGVEGEIAAHQSVIRQARQRLRELDGSPPHARMFTDVLRQNGQLIG